MGRRGKKTMPVKLKILTGNRSRQDLDKIKACEPPTVEGSLKAPPMLKGEALKMWKVKAPQLLGMGLFTEDNREPLQRYCITWQLYTMALKAIEEEGLSKDIQSGRKVAIPEAMLIRGYSDDMLKIEREFGLTPSSRAAYAVRNAEEKDPLADFIAGTG